MCMISMILAEVHVTIREDGVGVPVFLNEFWTFEDPRIAVSVPEGRSGLILKLVAVDSVSGETVTRFEEVAGDPGNLFTVNINGWFGFYFFIQIVFILFLFDFIEFSS